MYLNMLAAWLIFTKNIDLQGSVTIYGIKQRTMDGDVIAVGFSNFTRPRRGNMSAVKDSRRKGRVREKWVSDG